MALPQQVLEDSTETLYAYVPLEGTYGNMTSVAVRVQSPSVALPAVGSEDAATIETTDYTLGAAAAGASSIAWSAAAGTAPQPGVRYAIGAASGVVAFPLIVEVERVDTAGTTVYLRSRLPRAVSAGEKLKGMRVSHALTATETAEEGAGLARWSLTLTTPYKGRTVLTWDEEFRVRAFVFEHGLSEEEAIRLDPELPRLVAGSDISLMEAIESAWEAQLLVDLEARGIDIWRIKSAHRLRPVLASATHYHLVAGNEGLSEPSSARTHYQDRLDAVLASKRTWIDEDDSLAPPQDDDPAPSYLGGEFTR